MTWMSRAHTHAMQDRSAWGAVAAIAARRGRRTCAPRGRGVEEHLAALIVHGVVVDQYSASLAGDDCLGSPAAPAATITNVSLRNTGSLFRLRAVR